MQYSLVVPLVKLGGSPGELLRMEPAQLRMTKDSDNKTLLLGIQSAAGDLQN